MNPITVIIETPKNTSQKYSYDKKINYFKLKKVLPAGMTFPFDFGFIPGTKGEDGDPLDILVISEFKSFPGCAMDCRIIGAIKAEQSEKKGKLVRNDRFIGIPEESAIFKDIYSINDLPADILPQTEAFFKNYNELEGKQFEVIEILDAEEAEKLLK